MRSVCKIELLGHSEIKKKHVQCFYKCRQGKAAFAHKKDCTISSGEGGKIWHNILYEKTKRSSSFVEAWGKEFPWVVDGKDGMVCTPCMTYFGSCLKDDRDSLFQTGCQTYKKESLSRHASSSEGSG